VALGPCESTHDEWLREEGLSEQPAATALKRAFSGTLLQRMKETDVDTHILAERMQTSRAAVDRLLDPENDLVSLRSLYQAARALECRLRCELI
jgi:hypothetical protein